MYFEFRRIGMRKVLIGLFLLIPTLINAQTTNTVKWEYIGATPTVVGTYTQTLEINNSNVTIPSGACITKPGTTTDTVCSVVISALAAGNHSIRVAATLNGLTSEAVLNNINPANFPKVPGGLSITITININIP